MRAKEFLTFVSQQKAMYDNAIAISQLTRFDGGWEGWLQVEIGRALLQNPSNTCGREIPYTDTNGAFIAYDPGTQTAQGGILNGRRAARCDFFLRRNSERLNADATYVELKTNYLAGVDTQKSAWNRFEQDIAKISAVDGINPLLNSMAMIAYWGTLDKFPGGYRSPRIDWYWSGRLRSYIWDPNGVVVKPQDGQKVRPLRKAWDDLDGYEQPQKPRLIMIVSALIEEAIMDDEDSN